MAKVIDYINYYVTREGKEGFEKFHEQEGVVCKLSAVYSGGVPYTPPEAMIAQMDEAGVEKVFLTRLLMFSYIHKRPFETCTTKELVEVVDKYPNKFCGYATYNPFRIGDSLKELEMLVREHNFKGAFVHIFGFDIPLDDKKMYPLYAKCAELDVPVVMQVGYVLEGMPSEHGRPMLLDRIALDFPRLKIVGSHTGYPWCEELIAVSYKFDNVYFGVSAHFPKYLDPSVIRFINTRGQNKVIFGTNSIPFKPMLQQIEELGLREEAKNKLLYENAARLFKL